MAQKSDFILTKLGRSSSDFEKKESDLFLRNVKLVTFYQIFVYFELIGQFSDK